jgi:hypothetical protein
MMAGKRAHRKTCRKITWRASVIAITTIPQLVNRAIEKCADNLRIGKMKDLTPIYYRSIENTLDSTPMIVGRLAGLGGVMTSPGYSTASAEGRDYQVTYTNFDVNKDPFNHSLPYYFTDSTARSGLGLGALAPELKELYKTAPWVRE